MFSRWSLVLSRAAVRHYRKVPRLEDLPDAHLLPLVTLVGRPNVGKSALFNRLVKKRDALVYDTPGGHVTRDYREGLGQIGDLQFRLVDTSGLEPTAAAHTLQGRAALLTRAVLRGSQGVLMLLDAREGMGPADEELLCWLRRHNTSPLMLLANKADTSLGRQNLEQLQLDLASLGFKEATPISATSGEGMSELYQLLQPLVDAGTQRLQSAAAAAAAAATNTKGAAALAAPLIASLPRQHVVPEQLANKHQPASDTAAAVASAADEQQAEQFQAAEEAEVDRLLQQHLAATQQQRRQQQVQGEESGDTAEAGYLPAAAAAAAAEDTEDEEAAEEAVEQSSSSSSVIQGPVRLAILGLPNAGKSTLMNRLLGYERSLTGPEPGLTRDPTTGWLQHCGTDVQLIDTAGWKRAGAMHPTLSPTAGPQLTSPAGNRQRSAAAMTEQMNTATGSGSSSSSSDSRSSKQDQGMSKKLADASLAQAKRALSAVHVVVLLLEGPRLLAIDQAISKLELQMAGLAISQGKALVVGINKADAIPGGHAAAAGLRDQVAKVLESRFLPAGQLPVLSLSALDGTGAEQLLDAVMQAYSKWNMSVSSYRLRSCLAKHSLRFTALVVPRPCFSVSSGQCS